MNKRVAVILADGFEEVEALLVVDILRRASILCDTISIKDKEVKSSHGIIVKADRLITESSMEEYDMLVLPGGGLGADNLRDNSMVIDWVKYFNQNNKYIAAICAAPQVLAKAGIIEGRRITSYPDDKYKKILSSGIYTDEMVVVDNNIITSRGPATTFTFAYKLLDILGGDSDTLKEGMLYNSFCENIKK